MRQIVLATNNPGKLTEFKQMFAAIAIDIVAQNEFALPSVEETGLTFVENAIIKARYASQHTGLPALADDSGLQVDALNGGPGIYSSRYGGEGSSDQVKRQKLLADLTDVTTDNRGARFQCTLVYMEHAEDPAPIICQGSWEGTILTEERGQQGFGYDPIFYVPSHNCAAAELSAGVKNSLSHRGLALQQMLQQFSQQNI